LIGAGQIGGTLALLAEMKESATSPRRIIDGVKQGQTKALDLRNTTRLRAFKARMAGASDYSAIAGADVSLSPPASPASLAMSRDESASASISRS